MSEDIDVKKAEFITECLKKGYSIKAAEDLYKNKKRRDEIIAKAKGRKLSKVEKAIIEARRKSDKDIIERDWKENQPVKFAVHYINTINRICNKIDATKNEAEKEILRKEKHDFMEKNREWVEKNKKVVADVYNEMNNHSTPPNKKLSNDNKVLKWMKDRGR